MITKKVKCTNCGNKTERLYVKLLKNRGLICEQCIEICMLVILEARNPIQPEKNEKK